MAHEQNWLQEIGQRKTGTEKRGQTTFILRMTENGGRLRFSVPHFSDLK
jgi:hypothetical protein